MISFFSNATFVLRCLLQDRTLFGYRMCSINIPMILTYYNNPHPCQRKAIANQEDRKYHQKQDV